MIAILLMLLAALAGAGIVVQQVLNANLRVALGSSALAGTASFVVGLVCMLMLAVVMRDPLPPVATLARLPWWAWGGGFFGAFFIGASIFLLPQLGAATFIALLVAGQMIGSVAFDHFGWLGLTQRPIDVTRLIGIALIVAGVVMVRR